MVQDADGRVDPAQVAGALTDLARWLDSVQGDEGWLAALRFGVAGALARAGDGALAEAGFRRILSESPAHLWSWIALIDLALARGDAAGALAIGQAGLGHLPQIAVLRRKTAEAAEQADGPGAALIVLLGGADEALSPDDLSYAIALHRAAQTVDLAEPFCVALLAVRPGDALALLAMVEGKLTRGDGPGAVAMGQAALDQHPGHPEIRLRAAQAYLMAGDPGRAKALARDAGDGTGAVHAALAQIAGGDPAALMGDVVALLAKGAASDAKAFIAQIRACPDLPWYGALALVAEAVAKGAQTLAAEISAACADAPWPIADRHAFAIEDALLRHGPRIALDWIAAHPTAHRDAEAAERIGRVLVQAGTGALAARYLSRCCRRWPGDGALLERAVEAMIACGAADRVAGLCDSLAPGPEVGVARLRAGLALGEVQGPDTMSGPALPLMIERHLLAGDLAAAEASLARLTTTDGSLAEALICRPRATRLGALLNEARVLAAMGVDWMVSDPAALAPFAAEFFLPARRLIQLRPSAPAAAGGRPGLVHLIWPAPPEAEEGRRIIEAWERQGVGAVRVIGPGEARDLMRPHGANAMRAYDSAQDGAERADLAALACLLHEGGMAVVGPHWPGVGLGPWVAGLPQTVLFCTGAGAVANDVILAPPAHPLIATAFEMALAACLQGERDHRWVKTGPGLLTRAVAQRLIEDTPPTAPVPLMALQTLQARVHRWRGE